MPHSLRLVLATLTLATLASSYARADAIGWMEVSDGSRVDFDSLPSGNGLTHVATGRYAVTFFGLGDGLNSNVQVNASTAFSLTPHYCVSSGWNSFNGNDVTANVSCFDASGHPFDGDFTIFYQARNGTPNVALGEAFLWANQPLSASYVPNAQYNYNSNGTLNSVTRAGLGVYVAHLPGFAGIGGNPQVTAWGNTAAHCQIANWFHNAGGTNVGVACYNGSGQAADQVFSLAFTQKQVESAGDGSRYAGYVLDLTYNALGTFAPSGPTNFNNASGKKIEITNVGGGLSFVDWPYPPTVNLMTGMDMVSAVGSSGEYCASSGFGYGGSPKKPALEMAVRCWDVSGTPQNASYTATFMPRP